MLDFSTYYNGNNTLTYNALFNFIIGNRGGGKSFWGKYWAIRDFLRTGAQFVYLRRYKDELKKIKTYFSDIAEFFPEASFEVKGKDFYINEKLAGTAMSLSTSKIEKSNSFPKVNKIIFDEFILDKGVHRYLTGEVDYFLEFYETIARTRDNVRVFFFSNAITQTNPYFLFFKIELPYGKNVQTFYNDGSGNYTKRKTKKFPDLLIELVANEKYIEKKSKTRFGGLIAGTDFAEYAINNSFLRDRDDFLKKKTLSSEYRYSITFKGEVLGVWLDPKEGYYYISRDRDPSNSFNYSIKRDDHSINTMLLNQRSTMLNHLLDNFKGGNVRFEDMNVKNVFYDILRVFNV